MKIWIDGYEANQKNRVGSGQYGYEILRNLEKLDGENEYTVLLPDAPLDDLPKERSGWKYKILKPSKLWTRIALPLALYNSKDKPDLMFSPTHYIPRFSPVKRVCTIFDLAYLHYPEMFTQRDLWQLKNWTKFSIDYADHILAISDFTKNDIIKNYGVDQKKITTTPLGYDQDSFRPVKDKQKIKKTLSKYGICDNYIIYVGTIQPRKNLARLIEAFAYLVKNSLGAKLNHHPGGPGLELVIVGKTSEDGRKGWMYQQILPLPEKLGLKDRVIFTGFAPKEDLPGLLSGAKVFILPSLWEGFGIPVLEAMACGTPVIISNLSSLPEVAGQAGILIDPYSLESMTGALSQLLADGKLKKKKVQLGLKRVQQFSWEDCARKTLATLKEVGSGTV